MKEEGPSLSAHDHRVILEELTNTRPGLGALGRFVTDRRINHHKRLAYPDQTISNPEVSMGHDVFGESDIVLPQNMDLESSDRQAPQAKS